MGVELYVFCFDADRNMVSRCWDWLFEHSTIKFPLKILSLDLFSDLASKYSPTATQLRKEREGLGATSGKVSSYRTPPFEKPQDVAKCIRDIDNYKYFNELCCLYHYRCGREIHKCALTTSNRYAISLLEILTLSHEIPLVTGRHFPEFEHPEWKNIRRCRMLQRWEFTEFERNMKLAIEFPESEDQPNLSEIPEENSDEHIEELCSGGRQSYFPLPEPTRGRNRNDPTVGVSKSCVQDAGRKKLREINPRLIVKSPRRTLPLPERALYDPLLTAFRNTMADMPFAKLASLEGQPAKLELVEEAWNLALRDELKFRFENRPLRDLIAKEKKEKDEEQKRKEFEEKVKQNRRRLLEGWRQLYATARWMDLEEVLSTEILVDLTNGPFPHSEQSLAEAGVPQAVLDTQSRMLLGLINEQDEYLLEKTRRSWCKNCLGLGHMANICIEPPNRRRIPQWDANHPEDAQRRLAANYGRYLANIAREERLGGEGEY